MSKLFSRLSAIGIVCIFLLPGFLSAKTIVAPTRENIGVFVYDNGLEAFEQLLRCIDHANSYVELCPCMTGGRLLKDMLDHLDARMNEVPELCSYIIIQPTFTDAEDQSLLKALKQSYPDRFFYVFTGCPPSTSIMSPNVIEMHIKLSIIDGKYFILGGTNFEEFMCTRGDEIPKEIDSPRLFVSGVRRPLAFRDQDIMLRSVALGLELRKEFHKQFAMWDYYANNAWFINNPEDFADSCPPLTFEQAEATTFPELDDHEDLILVESSKVRVVLGGPHDKQPNPVTQEYVKLIRAARSSVKLAHMYFIPKDEILNALIDVTRNHNVHLSLITNGCHDLSPSITRPYAWGNRINYFALSYGSRYPIWKKWFCLQLQPYERLSIYEFAIWETQLHKKCMIIDNSIFVIGSYNLGKKSDAFDYESIVVIESAEVAEKAAKIFAKDIGLSRLVDKGDIFSWYFHPVHHTLGHLQLTYMPA
ncbi:cardiolipin synthetase,cardiolipin synthase [Chlamydia serpentis]|uniref:Cardiolipin synthetase,cardiolipin synthase n=1 Tax=Chlamydia serpentis TaxID=1967782 RepID=A0A2R8FAW2_9CHLA|nr:phosphatidylserine/phosphatidylglycerophosphate/cardiolipin synthase family protein [Chlamydia serpentis]SPN73570.1 cardiolipin synthetase,cardiolipin synthase [Chlamydia serpentis]